MNAPFNVLGAHLVTFEVIDVIHYILFYVLLLVYDVKEGVYVRLESLENARLRSEHLSYGVFVRV